MGKLAKIISFRALKEKDRKLAETIEYDQKNLPEWYGQDLELNEQETAEAFTSLDSREHEEDAGKRTEPHERAVLLKAKDDKRSFAEIAEQNKDELEKEGEREPRIAVLDKENYVRGTAPLHTVLEKDGIDRLLEMVDSGKASITHSGLPEAVYSQIEDGMEKGRVAWAGTINGESEYSENRNLDLTITNFMRSDNIHVYENAISGQEEAIEDEKEEEFLDRTSSDVPYYTGDYRGWDDPDYEPDDDLEHTYPG